MSTLTGLIIRSQSGFYAVQTEADLLVCSLRGRLKKGRRTGDVAAIGDRVEVLTLGKGKGVIEEVHERQRALSRLAPLPSGEYRQIIIANPDQAIFIFSCAQPSPHLGMLDRFLVIAEKQKIPPRVIANKVDLVTQKQARHLFQAYEAIGYPVEYTSVKTGLGIDRLRKHLTGKISVFAGPSGVGKSSLLNLLVPSVELETREVSEVTEKGKHTTVVREMYPLDGGGYVADTPGLKALALWDIEGEELDGYFPDLRSFVASCQFSDCTHVHEPGCAVLKAVDKGLIYPQRYASYLRMRFGEEE